MKSYTQIILVMLIFIRMQETFKTSYTALHYRFQLLTFFVVVICMCFNLQASPLIFGTTFWNDFVLYTNIFIVINLLNRQKSVNRGVH